MKIHFEILIAIIPCLFLVSCTKEITVNGQNDFASTLVFNFTQNHEGLPNEGFAVYGDYAFVMYLTGICDIYDLKTKRFVNTFHLGSYSSSNHANVADFGIEFPQGNTEFPAVYISECTGSLKRCFVENITTTGSQLIQTISPSLSKLGKGYTDWAVDRENRLLYCFTEASGISDTHYNILVFCLPQLSDGSNVVLADADMIDNWSISVNGTTQGLYIDNGYMYFPMSTGNGLKGCVLYIMNLISQDHEVSIMDLGKNFTNLECEDLYTYKDALLISFVGRGVYSFKNAVFTDVTHIP